MFIAAFLLLLGSALFPTPPPHPLVQINHEDVASKLLNNNVSPRAVRRAS